MNGISSLLLRSAGSIVVIARPPTGGQLLLRVNGYASKTFPINAGQAGEAAKCPALFKLNSGQVSAKLRRLFNLNKCHNRFVETTSQTRNYLIKKFLSWNVNAKKLDFSRKIENFQRLTSNSMRQRGVWNAGVFRQNFSTKPNAPSTPKPEQPPVAESTKAQTLSIFQRFKEAYKQHGKILIYCHIITCCGWFAGFFVLAEK